MRLPWATEMLIQTSMWFADYWWVLPLFPMGLFILIKLVRLSRSGSYAVDRMKLWIPLMGKIIEKSIVARTMVASHPVDPKGLTPGPTWNPFRFTQDSLLSGQ